MAQIDSKSESLFIDVHCTVPSADMALSTEHSAQLQTFDYLQDALQAIKEFEECTTSNYVVVEKNKDFGNEEVQ